MFKLPLLITFVDGITFEGDSEDWKICRSDGIDKITFGNVNFVGESFYILYEDWQTDGQSKTKFNNYFFKLLLFL